MMDRDISHSVLEVRKNHHCILLLIMIMLYQTTYCISLRGLGGRDHFKAILISLKKVFCVEITSFFIAVFINSDNNLSELEKPLTLIFVLGINKISGVKSFVAPNIWSIYFWFFRMLNHESTEVDIVKLF